MSHEFSSTVILAYVMSIAIFAAATVGTIKLPFRTQIFFPSWKFDIAAAIEYTNSMKGSRNDNLRVSRSKSKSYNASSSSLCQSLVFKPATKCFGYAPPQLRNCNLQSSRNECEVVAIIGTKPFITPSRLRQELSFGEKSANRQTDTVVRVSKDIPQLECIDNF
ncbi:hypothetical protein GQX74_001483 [Glossina fuscipes]|nr:hypothetical protein GQX74_001483 [Glossina fuscipes]